MKNQKGITLIALVITIIVMLILVVVTVTFALGEDGIIGNARKATKEQKAASIKEAITLTKADIVAEALMNPTQPIPDDDNVQSKIQSYLGDGITVSVSLSGKIYTITSDDVGEEFSEELDVSSIDFASTPTPEPGE